MVNYEEVAKEIKGEIDAGEYECPNCGFEVGLFEQASCTECGYIPEENRATGKTEKECR